jgi:3-oxoacyl-[acyl-carrier-protein] synthase III
VLGARAARMALEQAGVAATDIDLILFSTLSPDHYFPGSACFLQRELGHFGCPAIDVRQQCAGFLYALVIGEQFIRAGSAKRILVVAAEVQSHGLNLSPQGKDLTALFGDGAGACVLVPSANPNHGLVSWALHADGRYAEDLWMEAPGSASRQLAAQRFLTDDQAFPKMKGVRVFRHSIACIKSVLGEILAPLQFTLTDVDLIVPHQANIRILEHIANDLHFPIEKMVINLQRYGNTSSASIPIALSEANQSGQLKPDQWVALAAFGAGYVWGGALFHW